MNVRWLARMGIVGMLFCVVSLTDPASARADAASAAHRLFVRLAQARWEFDAVSEQNSQAESTLIRNLYVLSSKGQWITFFNDTGDLYLRNDRFVVLPPGGRDPQNLSGDEQHQLLLEVMNNIYWDRLIKVQYGNGGGRHVLEQSALDCPACRHLEIALAHQPKGLNTTFYIVPIALRSRAQGAEAIWNNAARIWCSKDSQSAWRTYWVSHAVPPETTPCAWTASRVEDASDELSQVLGALGVPQVGLTPMLMSEDGQRIFPNAVWQSADRGRLNSLLGPDSRPAAQTLSTRWLADWK